MKKILCCFVVLCFTFMFCSSCGKKGENSPNPTDLSAGNNAAPQQQQSFFRLGNPCIYIPITVLSIYAVGVAIASYKDGSFKWKIFF